MLDNPLIIAAAFTLLMGVAWRIRGGWLALPSTTLARLVPATVYAIGAYLMSDNLWHLLMGPLLFLGTIWPWGQWQDMGRVEENDDLVGMAGRGMLLCLAPGAFLALQGYPLLLLIFGFLMGPIYWLSWRIKFYTMGGEVGTGLLLGVLTSACYLL